MVAPLFGSHAQHAYFYGVARPTARLRVRAMRPKAAMPVCRSCQHYGSAFPASGWAALYANDNLHGAVFGTAFGHAKSRLAGGLAIAWVLGKSSQMVNVE